MSERGRSHGELNNEFVAVYEPPSLMTQQTAEKMNLVVETFPSKLKSPDLSVQQFGFLYSKESDKIGAMVSKEGVNQRPMAPSAAACARRRTLRISQMTADSEPGLVEPTANHILTTCYQHGAKVENPRFATTSNEYGKSTPSGVRKSENVIRLKRCRFKKEISLPNCYTGKQAPTIATIVPERFIRPQTFSKSFSSTTARNTSLTTCMTKSNVHSNLDPHFT